MSGDEKETLLKKTKISLVDGRCRCFMDFYDIYIEPKIKLTLKEFQIMQDCYYVDCKHIEIIGLKHGPDAQLWADKMISAVLLDRELSRFR